MEPTAKPATSATESELIAPDGHRIPLRTWAPRDAKPRALLHISHGMAEHGGRYEALALELLACGWVVVAHDHRGHGDLSRNADRQAKGDGIAGHFCDQHGWARVTGDVAVVQDHLRTAYPGLPLAMMGHSMGTLITLSYLVSNPGAWPDAVVLSGASRDRRLKIRCLRQIVRFETWRRGRRRSSNLIHALTFGAFSKSVSNPRTRFDWLSRDSAEVQAYITNPGCGFECSTKLWQDLANGLLQVSEPGCFKQWPDSLPVYLLSGDRDPVGAFGKGPKALVRALKADGQQDLTLKLYPRMRHEPLHEIGRERVIAELSNWLESRIGNPETGNPSR